MHVYAEYTFYILVNIYIYMYIHAMLLSLFVDQRSCSDHDYKLVVVTFSQLPQNVKTPPTKLRSLDGCKNLSSKLVCFTIRH